jgi:hypothetical protein
MHLELTASLERALVREILGAWKQVNEAYFKGALRAPVLELVPTRFHLGRWMRETRTIEISRPLVLEQSWGVVVEVLKHEMAHQYVHEVLGEVLETAHGPAFRAACARLGIDARAAGLPVPSATTGGAGAPHGVNAVHAAKEQEERVVERIAKLLALAESKNQHEAEAAMAAAQRLMLKYNLEARHASASRDYAHRHLGAPTGRVTEHERILAMILGKHFFVEVIWVPVYRPLQGKRGSVVEICGSAANLAIAEYVHAFLMETAERLWRDHKRASSIVGDRDRRTFLAGVMSGFAEKLARQTTTHAEQGLVWVRDADLGSFFRRRHPYLRHVRHTGNRRTEAYAHGKEAGRRIVLHRGVSASAGDRGHLLLPGPRPRKA